jgi:hypothetical protein
MAFATVLRTRFLRTTRHGILLAVGLAWGLCACGPGAATPMPEPPSIDVNKVGGGEEVSNLASPTPIRLTGQAGAAPPNATVRVTNLDETSDPVATSSDAEGRFAIDIVASPGDELRFEARTSDWEAEPSDARVKDDLSGVTAVERPGCLALAEGYTLDVIASEPAAVELTNHCAESVTIQNARMRDGQRGLSVVAGDLVLLPEETGELDVQVATASTVRVDDILFFDAVIAGEVVRFPVSVRLMPQ